MSSDIDLAQELGSDWASYRGVNNSRMSPVATKRRSQRSIDGPIGSLEFGI